MKQDSQDNRQPQLEIRERAMVEGILEGSPDGVGVVVVRLDCGCRKMAAVSVDGEPASKVIMYRDNAETICDTCKKDQGAFMRVTEQFIHWQEPVPDDATQARIANKVFGTPHPSVH
ncbi:MAG: hypothetical protein V2J11_09080 [Desulfofustis sp.]|nr:hypothetical protein [Desulfofustis sp.]